MVKINIGKADCIDNETFESYVESVGLSCFEDSGEPKDIDSLSFEAKLTEADDSVDGCLIIFKEDLDASTFEEIKTNLQADKNKTELIVRYHNPEIA